MTKETTITDANNFLVQIDFKPYVESIDRNFDPTNGGDAPSTKNRGLMFNVHNLCKTLNYQVRVARYSALNQLNEADGAVNRYIKDRPEQTEEDRQSDPAYISLVNTAGTMYERFICLNAGLESAKEVFKNVTGREWVFEEMEAEFGQRRNASETKTTAMGAAYLEAKKKERVIAA